MRIYYFGIFCNMFVLLLLPLYASASTYSSIKGACHLTTSSSSIRNDEGFQQLNQVVLSSQDQRQNVVVTTNRRSIKIQSMTVLTTIPRGGSLYKEEEEEDGLILGKLRNLIRSMIEIGERNSPTLVSIFRSMIGMLETLSGTKLLPEKEKKKTKRSKKKEVKKSSNETDKNPLSQKKKKVTGAAAVHISKELKSNNPNYRIQRELKEFLQSPPPNLKVNVGKNIRIWIVTMTGAKNTIYEGEKYRLRVQFPADYPTSPPSVYFLQPTPRHEHVYTNGDICLSLLGKDWRPTMTAQSIAVSILSILSGAQRKSLPMDNARNALNKPGAPQDDWVYHDDNC